MSKQQHDVAPARQDGPPATPWWVKLLAVTAALLVVIFVLVQMLGGGHGPGMHGG
jgi:hypothetical protein